MPQTGRAVVKHLAAKLEQIPHADRLVRIGQRLWAFAAKGPGYHCTYGRWLLEGWWHKRTGFPPSVDDAAFFAALDLGQHGLTGTQDAVDRRDYVQAKSQLAAYFATRSQPRFHFSWANRDRIFSAIPDRHIESTIRAADEVCQNKFRFRRADPMQFGQIDWTHRPEGNTDWTWDLNRHAYFVTLGKAYWYTQDEKYATKFSELSIDWLEANPAAIDRQNWSSVLEIAVRINNWIWAFYLFRQAPTWGQEDLFRFLKGLLTHARFLAARIERHAANNHLLLEAKALAYCGLLFPEFKEAGAWQRSGLRTLWDEVRKQVCADGVHGERAPLYHRRVLSDLIEMLVLLENNAQPVPADIIGRLGKMIDFDVNISKPDGTIPLFSDSALTEIQARFSHRGRGAVLFDQLVLDGKGVDEDMVWLLGDRKRVRAARGGATAPASGRAHELASRPFPQGGYYVMRGGGGQDGLYLAFDCGPFGYEPVPAHGHADALSLDLYAYGHTLITDSGVYSYHAGGEWRNYFRGTRSHNTVVVDDQDQSVLLDKWRVLCPAQATLHAWETSKHLDFVDGSHNGYERLPEPITHRRQIIFVRPEYWIVLDVLTGSGNHRYDLYYHLMPGMDARLVPESGTLRAQNQSQAGIAIVPLATGGLQAEVIAGATAPIQGWVSLYSGEKLPAPTLHLRQEGMAPVQFCTVLFPYQGGEKASLALSALDIEVKESTRGAAIKRSGLSVETDQYIDHIVLDRSTSDTRKIFAGYETDAHLFYARHEREGNEPVRVVTSGGDLILFRDRPLSENRDRCKWRI